MDRTDKRRKGGALRTVWLCAFMLAMISVLTVPLALSKYVAPGEGQPGARVAKWEPKWEFEPSGSSLAANQLGAGFVNPATGTNYVIKWKITNKGEVAMHSNLFPKITDVPSLKLDKDRAPLADSHAIGAVGEYTDVGGRVDFNTVSLAGTVAAGTTGITSNAAIGVTLPPNAAAAQQEFTFTFKGVGAPGGQVTYNSDSSSAGNVANYPHTWSYDATNDFRAYRVNFDSASTQVD